MPNAWVAGGRGIVESGVGAAAEKEAVVAAAGAVAVIPDDLARGVDAPCKGAQGGRGSVECGEGAAA